MPVFVDVDRDTMGLSPDRLSTFLEEQTEQRKEGCYNKISGKKGAALTAIAYWLLQSKLFSMEAFIDAAKIIKNAEKLIASIKNVELINKEIEN